MLQRGNEQEGQVEHPFDLCADCGYNLLNVIATYGDSPIPHRLFCVRKS